MDLARGVAVVLVLFEHTSEYMGHHGPYGVVQSMLTFLRMPLLMLISGTLVAKYPAWKLHRRARQLAWLTLCWTPLMLLSHRVGNIGGKQSWSLELLNPNTELWYLWALTLLLTIDPLVSRISPLVVLAVTFIAKMLGVRGMLPHEVLGHDVIGWMQLLSYCVYFYLGKYTSHVVRDLADNRHIGTPVMLAVFCAAFNLLDVPTFTSLTFAAAFLALCPLLLRYVPFATIGVALGRRTLPIYLGHAVLLRPLSPWLWDMHGATAIVVALMLLSASLLVEWVADRSGLGFLYREPDWKTMSSRSIRMELGFLPDRMARTLPPGSREERHRSGESGSTQAGLRAMLTKR